MSKSGRNSKPPPKRSSTDSPSPDEITVTGGELATWLNLTWQHVDKLIAGGTLPKKVKQRIPLKQAVQAYTLMQQMRTGKTVAKKQDMDFEIAQARHRKLMLDNEERERNLIPLEEATQLAVDIIALADESFEALADAIDTQCSPGADVVEAIEQHCQSTADSFRVRLTELNGEKSDGNGHANGRAEPGDAAPAAAGAS